MIEIIIACLVVVSFIAFIFVLFNNKFLLSIIKIDKAEEDIQLFLDKKKELLDRSRAIINKALKSDKYLSDLDGLGDDANNFEKHNILKSIYNDLFKILDENEKLLKSETLVKILDELNDNEEDIVGAIKFYNDTVVEYNQLKSVFPSNIVALFKKYKKKEFYNNEKREIFEILNEK